MATKIRPRTGNQAALGMSFGGGPVKRSLRAVSVELGVPWASLYRWVRKAHPDRFGYYRPASTVASDAPPFVADCAHGHNTDQCTIDAIRQDNVRLAREPSSKPRCHSSPATPPSHHCA